MNAFNWIIGIFLIAVSIFYVYMNVKTLRAASAARKAFMENHPDARIENIGMKTVWLYGVLGVICLAVAIVFVFSSQPERLLVIMTYGALALFFVSLTIEAWNDSKMYCTPDAFLNRDEQVRYRNISKINVGKNFFKPSTILMHNGKDLQTSKTIAKWALASYEAWQQQKKDAKKQRRKGRGKNAVD